MAFSYVSSTKPSGNVRSGSRSNPIASCTACSGGRTGSSSSIRWSSSKVALPSTRPSSNAARTRAMSARMPTSAISSRYRSQESLSANSRYASAVTRPVSSYSSGRAGRTSIVIVAAYRRVAVNEVDVRRTAGDDAGVGEPDLSRLLLEASRVLGAEIVAGLQERGFPDARPGHAALFMHIDRRWGTRLTDLARRARMTKQGMMLLVDDLETRGYVRRVPDTDDSRAKMVRLTARGRRFVAEARRAVAAVEARARRELGERRYEALRDSLEFLVGGGEGFEEA